MKTRFFRYIAALFGFLIHTQIASAQQGFVHASGTAILDNNGNNLIFRSIGTGNWMLQEGYMMNTSGATNGTQWHFKQKLIQAIGLERTNEFYEAWLDNNFAKPDVDAMADWGFNAVRVAMHYKVFTLPIEEEPVAGQDTWLESGLARLVSLLEWCAANKMYLILDMHGCPGAQGDDSNISDYDSSKPSLWQSEENKRKLIALWRKLAERFADSPWIGAYDLINEPKWSLPDNNRDLWNLQKAITAAIRGVDKNHLIFIEGNNWGNDYNGLPALWDNNMGLSFHKYWNYNTETAIDWIVNMGAQRNCPVWLGETGENSNTWFTDVIALCESKNVGWSMWPVKKTGLNNVLRSQSNSNYSQMLNAWRGNGSVTAEQAYQGVMQWAEDHQFEKCRIQYDVIDAMITRPHTNETRPFKTHVWGTEIAATDYDFGPAGEAYFDTADADYHGAGESYTAWNSGGNYRNDGVDIESCTDQPGNGYAVGWIEDGEWLSYTLEAPDNRVYAIQIRYASQTGGGKVYVEINGERVSKNIDLPATGSWTTWASAYCSNIIVPQGTLKVRLVFPKGGFNLNFFKFTAPKETAEVNLELLHAQTHRTKDRISLLFNKEVGDVNENMFNVSVNGQETNITAIEKDADNPKHISLAVDTELFETDRIVISSNNGIFSNREVENTMAHLNHIPCKIEAEDCIAQNGFRFEECSDTGGGLDAGYAATGHYLDFFLYAGHGGDHRIDLRVAVNAKARLAFYDVVDEQRTLLTTASLPVTGGWQNWQTQSVTVKLKKGKNILRVYAITEGFNFNWLEIREREGTGVSETVPGNGTYAWPNPVSGTLYIESPAAADGHNVALYDRAGKAVFKGKYPPAETVCLDMEAMPGGVYLLEVLSGKSRFTGKIVKKDV
jgi:hypothetical protein